MTKKLKTLIISSLGLLLVFLIYWNRQNYLNEKVQLQRDVRLIYIASLRKVDEQFLQQIMPQLPMHLQQKDVEIQMKSTINEGANKEKITIVRKNKLQIISSENHQKDSAKSMKIVVVPVTKSDTKIHKIIKKDTFARSIQRSVNVQDLLSLQIELPQIFKDTFATLFAKANLPISYQFVTQTTQGGILVESENFIVANQDKKEALNVELFDYQWFLFKKIFVQLLFSFVLLGSVVASLWLLYKNWREQQQLIVLKNDLIANITHELKTPIATVSAAIEALRDFGALENKKRTQEYLHLSTLELQRLSLLVDKVLKMSMFEQQKMTLHLEQIDLNSLLENVIMTMQPVIEKKKAIVQFAPSENPIFIKGDKIHLSNVFYNLIDNALKYSNIEPKIEIKTVQSEQETVLQFADNGIGIDKHFHQKIFEKFFRVPTGNRHDVKGYGLGLSYVAEVIKLHQGKIWVESKLGKGSRFFIRISSMD